MSLYKNALSGKTMWVVFTTFLVLCWLCPIYVGARNMPISLRDDVNYCKTNITVNYNSTSGTVTDHIGAGNYLNNMNCIWILELEAISPPVVYITIMFEELSTEYSFDLVTMTDVAGHTFTFSGDQLPRRFNLPGNLWEVIFSTSNAITSTGFSFDYYGMNCLNNCSENGYCVNQQCQCDPGWSGPDCSVGTCATTGCSEAGACSLSNGTIITPNATLYNTTNPDSTCQCNPNRYGGDCSTTWCTLGNVYDDPTATFSDHAGWINYYPTAACSWLLTPPKPFDVIQLTFSAFDLAAGDFLSVYDGADTSFPLIAQYSGHNIPQTVYGHEDAMFITFEANGDIATSHGFTASYDTLFCPGSCSGRGFCFESCVCSPGWTGDNCSTAITCPNNCSGHGDCIAGACSCDDGWGGRDCAWCKNSSCETKSGCSGQVEIASVPGIITDSVGNYTFPSDTACTWIIDPTAHFDSLAVIFEYFNFSASDMTLLAYDDADEANASIIAVIGNQDSGYLPAPILSPSRSLRLSFHTKSTRTPGLGFSVYHRGYNCTNSCSGNGDCVGGVCVCYLGWNGTDCSSSICPNNCSYPSGRCDNSTQPKCVCNVGFTGPDCSSPYCKGQVTLSNVSGTFSDHSYGTTYKQGQRCSWIIINPAGDPITLAFESLQVEGSYVPNRGQENIFFLYDYVTIKDLNSTVPNPYSWTVRSGSTASNFNGKQQYGIDLYAPNNNTLYGTKYPAPYLSFSNKIQVTFTSDSDFNLKGFQAYWSFVNQCPEGCNGKGYCIRGSCYCFEGDGPSCNQSANATTLAIGANYTGVLSQWQWTYFVVPVDEAAPSLALSIDAPASDAPGLYSVYISKNVVPLRTKYTLRYPGGAYTSDIKVALDTVEDYYVGIYAYKTLNFTISANYSCLATCLGICVNYQCVCPNASVCGGTTNQNPEPVSTSSTQENPTTQQLTTSETSQVDGTSLQPSGSTSEEPITITTTWPTSAPSDAFSLSFSLALLFILIVQLYL